MSARRDAARTSLVTGVCLVLGAGLLAGAAIGRLMSGDAGSALHGAGSAREFAEARLLWHGLPVDDLFPPTVKGKGAGPGGADRTWIRVGVARDSGCDGAFDPALAKAFAPVGCARLLRATYTDVTSTDVTTVGLLVTNAGPADMTAFGKEWTASRTADRTDAMPLPVAFPGTDAASFGPSRRGSWAVDVSGTLPLVSYAVSGFADGRATGTPQPAQAATATGATTVAAQSGLGYDAAGLAKALGARFLSAVRSALHPAHDGAAS